MSPARRATSVIVVVLVSLVMPWATQAAAAYPAPTVELSGHGYGHGRGMGQWGSLGYALDQGWSYRQILDHFYGGTTMGEVAQGAPMTVQLTRFDDQDTLVTNERGGLSTNAGPGSFTALRARLVGPNTFAVDHAADCGGDWMFLGQVSGPVVFSPPATGSDDRADMVQACEPDGARRWLRGDVLAVDAGGPRTVNRVDIQSYLRGVVPQESPASWGDLGGGQGMEALRAQAVAARSYAETENRSPEAKTCDTTSCQVYGGVAVESNGGFTSIEQSTTDAAVAETAGQVRRFTDGSVSRTEFSSSTGGWTAGGTFPAVPDEGDSRSPNHDWSASVPVVDIETAYPAIGTLQAVEVTGRNGHGDMGGRVTTLALRGSSGSVNLAGLAFRLRFGLRSDWFQVQAGSGPPGTPPASGDRLDVFGRGPGNDLVHTWFDGRWGGWESLGGSLTSDPAAVSWANGRLDVFGRGPGNELRHTYFDGRWGSWESLGGNLSSGADVASWANGRLDVFARGINNDLQHTWFDGRWHGWESLGGNLASDPTAVSWANGRLDVFAKGPTNDLVHTWFDGRWGGWESLGGNLASGPDVASWANGRLDVFGRGPNNDLVHTWFNGRWGGWESLGGNLASDPGAVSWGAGRLDVFGRGSANELRHTYFDGRWGGWESLGGNLASGPDAASWSK